MPSAITSSRCGHRHAGSGQTVRTRTGNNPRRPHLHWPSSRVVNLVMLLVASPPGGATSDGAAFGIRMIGNDLMTISQCLFNDCIYRSFMTRYLPTLLEASCTPISSPKVAINLNFSPSLSSTHSAHSWNITCSIL